MGYNCLFLSHFWFYIKITYKLPNHDIFRILFMIVCKCAQKKNKVNENYGGDYYEKKK